MQSSYSMSQCRKRTLTNYLTCFIVDWRALTNANFQIRLLLLFSCYMRLQTDVWCLRISVTSPLFVLERSDRLQEIPGQAFEACPETVILLAPETRALFYLTSVSELPPTISSIACNKMSFSRNQRSAHSSSQKETSTTSRLSHVWSRTGSWNYFRKFVERLKNYLQNFSEPGKILWTQVLDGMQNQPTIIPIYFDSLVCTALLEANELLGDLPQSKSCPPCVLSCLLK